MNLMDYIKWTKETDFVDKLESPPHYYVMGLVSEAGEVADVLAKSMREGSEGYLLSNLREELGDCMYYIACICRYHGWSFEQLTMENQKKLTKRHHPNLEDNSQ